MNRNNKEIIVNGPHKDFESIKKIDEDGVEYWTARELMLILGYSNWQNFDEVVKKAQQSCVNSRQFPQDHFIDVSKMIKLAKDAVRQVNDYRLDRYACYLIAQNGDVRKQQIAFAQTYFAVQTRNQEVYQKLSNDGKRIRAREEVKDKNKQLFSTARLAGVSNFGKFNDAGYKGLHTMPLSEIESKKKIKEIGGEMPENLKSEKHIKEIKKIRKSSKKVLK